MKIHEYQATELFAKHGIPVNPGTVATTPEEAKAFAQKTGKPVVIKAQVHVGGRGKAGGVKLAKTPDEAYAHAKAILGMDIKGCTVRKVLVAGGVDIDREFYAGLVQDYESRKIVFLASKAGGVDIEEVAAKTPEKIKKVFIDPLLGFRDFQAREIAMALFDDPEQVKAAVKIFKQLFECFVKNDCSLAEINPLVLTKGGQILALDAKINFEDNALDRHPDLVALRDPDEEDMDEIDAKASGLSFIKLDGNIGCIVNGAGLAMATMDIVKLFGGEPANFLDVGGSSNPNKIVKAFQLLLKNKKIEAVLINIFGGITRCDDIANGLLQAKAQLEIPVPIVIRLTGTNEEKAKEILSAAGIMAYSDMEEAVRKVIASFQA